MMMMMWRWQVIKVNVFTSTVNCTNWRLYGFSVKMFTRKLVSCLSKRLSQLNIFPYKTITCPFLKVYFCKEMSRYFYNTNLFVSIIIISYISYSSKYVVLIEVAGLQIDMYSCTFWSGSFVFCIVLLHYWIDMN